MKQKLKKQETGFTQVKNNVLTDSNLSLKAKGLFAYLYSKPDGWDFNGDRIAKEHKDERKAIFSGLKELEEKGYLERKKMPTGKIIYHLWYEPIDQNEHEPVDQKGKLPKRQIAEKVNISNKEEESNKENKIIKTSSKEEGSKLQMYGKPLINYLIDTLKGFNGTTGLDGSIKWNRIYAKNVSDKIKREFISRSNKEPSDEQIVDSLKMILEKADSFHKEKMTDFGYINKNFYKIIKSSQNKKGKNIII